MKGKTLQGLRKSVFSPALWAALLLPLQVSAAPPPRLTDFTPQGTVKRIRQLVARFSEPMVALGDPRTGTAAFDVTCPIPGTGRWVDSRTWAYDFNQDLPGGLVCTASRRPDLRTLKGQPVAGQADFSFATGGPAVTATVPYDGDDGLDEDQAFVLTLDAPATDESVLGHVAFRVAGLPDPVGVTIVSDAQRDEILKSVPYVDTAQPLLVLRARQRFPSGTSITLVWGAGILSTHGVATDAPQTFEFKTRPAFTARVICQRANAGAECVPLTPISVVFSAPVAWEQVRHALLRGPGDARWQPAPPDNPEAFVNRIEFRGPFPDAARFQLDLPTTLIDDAGRPLSNAADNPFTIRTDPYPPLAKFSARFGIIEAAADPTLPVTLRNLEPEIRAELARLTTEHPAGLGASAERLLERLQGTATRIAPERLNDILPWLRRVGEAPRNRSVFQPPTPPVIAENRFTVPKPNGPEAFEVVGIPLQGRGLYVVELASPKLGAYLLGKPEPMYVPTAALVTNMAVHFKWGRDNALVWVTTLDTAQPVPDARISVLDCTGAVRWSGTTDPSGIARTDSLPQRDKVPRCPRSQQFPIDPNEEPFYFDESSQTGALDDLDTGLLVVAQTPDDLSFVHSSWERGIEAWRFGLPSENWEGPVTAHTVFDRTLFRAGDTVHMKHILRLESLAGFSLVPAAQRPTHLTLQHEGSDDKYDLPLAWDARGAGENTWTIPATARLGRYAVVLTRPNAAPPLPARTSGTFRVEEFRVPLMRATVQLPAQPQVAVTSVPVDVSVAYLAGGGAANLPVVLRSQIRPRSVKTPPEFDTFTFATGPVKEGRIRLGEGTAEAVAEGASRPGPVQRQELVLDATGTARATVSTLPASTAVRELLAELEYRDPNGERQTVSSVVPLWPAQWLVGIAADQWARSDGTLHARVAVIDVAGQPVPNATVRVDAHSRKTYSTRKRLVGGFYGYDSVEETGPSAGIVCEGTTNSAGIFVCDGKSPTPGNLVLEAAVTDPAAQTSYTQADVWVVGDEDWWFAVHDSDRIDVLPERLQYNPGDTARLQVRMPFRAATALVTTEREGVLDAQVVPLRGSDPTVEVPVQDAYAPNVFVSVFVVRGRVAGVEPTARLDLGKPAWKLGIAEFRVGWQAHTLGVTVTTDRPVYNVRQTAHARVAVKTASGEPPPAGSDVAIAAVDEGLLELQPNTSWDLLAAMMGRRGYGVRTATAQMEVVGKRHYGLKAIPLGGGGGRQATRELFDTLLVWNASVPLAADGTATIDIPLNDSLTSFRIVAVATGGVGQFGTGSTAVRSTQDLMLLSGLPPVVRAGDRFRAEFTVRNTTNREMGVAIGGRVEGLSAGLEPRKLRLSAGQADVIGWDIEVPVGPDALVYEMEASESGGPSDRLRVSQRVRPAVPVRTFQATLTRWPTSGRETVAAPPDALPGRGGIRVQMAPSLSDGLAGVRDYMTQYPFTCMEQRVSRAVALGDPQLWTEVSAALPSHLDGSGLVKYFPTDPAGSDVLTSYILSILAAAELPLAPDVHARMESGLTQFVQGAVLRSSPIDAADLPLRKLAAVAALARGHKAEPAMLDSVAIEPNLWPTSAVLDWWTILTHVPKLPNHAARLASLQQILRSRLNVQGTAMGLSTEQSPSLWWLMVCPDTSAVRLAAQAITDRAWKGDAPKLMRGALGRLQRGHWDCTTSNAWGTVAARKFAAAFEATPVTGAATVTLGSDAQRRDWAPPPAPIQFDFPWPSRPTPLVVQQNGTGAPWITIESRAAIPLREPLSTGYRITRTVTPIERRVPDRWSRGDLLRIRLDIDAQSDMTWVAVSDPIPAGASHLGTGLGRDSQIDRSSDQDPLRSMPTFVERAFDTFRAYFAFVPKGPLAVEYVIRLNQSGTFQLPPTRAEALYAPEMFGETPNAPMTVE